MIVGSLVVWENAKFRLIMMFFGYKSHVCLFLGKQNILVTWWVTIIGSRQLWTIEVFLSNYLIIVQQIRGCRQFTTTTTRECGIEYLWWLWAGLKIYISCLPHFEGNKRPYNVCVIKYCFRVNYNYNQYIQQ